MQLTDHFTLEELVFSSTAERLGINNTPSLEIVARLTRLAMGLERVRALLANPMHVDSGFRCEGLERVLTAKDYANWLERRGLAATEASWQAYFATKAHPQGYAADFTCAAFGTPIEIARAIAESDIAFDQCIQEGTWVHISFDPAMRRECLTANFGPNGPTYSKGL